MKKSSNLVLVIPLLLFFSLSLDWVYSYAQTKQTRNQTLSARDIAKNTMPSMVLVIASGGEKEAMGSGFFVDQDLIATNFHVIKGASIIEVFSLGSEKPIAAVLVAVDKENDIAVLKVAGIKGRPLLLATKNDIAIGDVAYAVGNPKGLEGTFSNGIISSIRENGDIQITTPISPGSSGGPVLNEKGQVIGIATYFVVGGQNLNFAKPTKPILILLSAARKGNVIDDGKDLAKSTTVQKRNEADEGDDIAEFLEMRKKKRDDLIVLGEMQADKNNYQDAIQSYRQALELDPSCAKAYFNMAQSYESLGNDFAAIPFYSKAVELDPRNPSYRFTLGMRYCEYKAESASLDQYSALVSLNSNLQTLLKTFICKNFGTSTSPKVKHLCSVP